MFLPWFPSLRPVDSIRDFTRETLSAVIVDIESRDWRRHYNKQKGISTEHPRASTSDDVEFFFSILRDMVGRDFTHKEVNIACTCILIMYSRLCLSGERLVRNSQRGSTLTSRFSYTSTHQRFFEGDRPDFCQPASKLRHESRAA